MAKPAHPSRTRTQPLPPVTPPFKVRRQKAEQPLSDPTVNPVSGPKTHFQTNQASEVTHQAYLCRHSSPQALLPGPCHSQTNRTPSPQPFLFWLMKQSRHQHISSHAWHQCPFVGQPWSGWNFLHQMRPGFCTQPSLLPWIPGAQAAFQVLPYLHNERDRVEATPLFIC